MIISNKANVVYDEGYIMMALKIDPHNDLRIN
jgi:hypothetical protein